MPKNATLSTRINIVSSYNFLLKPTLFFFLCKLFSFPQVWNVDELLSQLIRICCCCCCSAVAAVDVDVVVAATETFSYKISRRIPPSPHHTTTPLSTVFAIYRCLLSPQNRAQLQTGPCLMLLLLLLLPDVADVTDVDVDVGS